MTSHIMENGYTLFNFCGALGRGGGGGGQCVVECLTEAHKKRLPHFCGTVVLSESNSSERFH